MQVEELYCLFFNSMEAGRQGGREGKLGAIVQLIIKPVKIARLSEFFYLCIFILNYC